MLSVKLLTNPLLTVLRVVRGSLDIPRNKRESSSSLTTLRSKALSYLHNSFPTVSTRWAAGGQQGALCHSKALISSFPQVQHPFIPQEGNVQPRRDEAVSEHAS